MKKRLLLIIVLAVLIGFVFGAALISENRADKTPVNASRRDGEVTASLLEADEDLEAVSGEETLQDTQNTPSKEALQNAKEREEADSALYSSLETTPATNPTNKEVESVTVLLLPESVSIGAGDQDAFYQNEEFSDVIPVDAESFNTGVNDEELPSKYDSRNVDGKRFVSLVQDQGYSSLCWSYAAIGAVECDILRHNPDISYNDINLSEKHLSYYNMHKNDGSYGGLIDDDYRELVNADNEDNAWLFDYDTGYMSMGGVANYCISLLTSWKGPVSENKEDAYEGLYGEKYMYTENSEAPSDAYNSEYHVQDVIQIPSTFENRNMIKRMIMEHGAVTAGIKADSIYFSNNSTNLYSSYSGEIEIADHEVILIGWDDEYPATNFKIKPPQDGAFICRNSWGENVGEKGFFYLSYYDQTFSINNVAAYSSAVVGAENYFDHNYQTAGFLTYVISAIEDEENYVTAFSESKNPYGILYTAESDEVLKAIGLMALDCYQQYEFDVYVNPEHEDNVVSLSKLKKPAVSFKASSISGGFHTFELPQELQLAAGDEFFIYVSPSSQGRLVFESSVDNVSKPNYDEWNNLTGNIHNSYSASGLSYYISEDGTQLLSQSDKDFFIKAYTDNVQN